MPVVLYAHFHLSFMLAIINYLQYNVSLIQELRYFYFYIVIAGNLPPSTDCWYDEYKRLYYHTPVHLCEALFTHTDEVLDVSFAHNGSMFCTVSKDESVQV